MSARTRARGYYPIARDAKDWGKFTQEAWLLFFGKVLFNALCPLTGEDPIHET